MPFADEWGGCFLSLLLTACTSVHLNKNRTEKPIQTTASPGIRGLVTHKMSQGLMSNPASQAKFPFSNSEMCHPLIFIEVLTDEVK